MIVRNPILPEVPKDDSIESATQWRSSILEIIENLHNQLFDYLTEISATKLVRATTQSIPTASYTKVGYNIELFDELGEGDTTLFRFIAKQSGYYQISASVLSANVAWGIGEYWQLWLYKNGVRYEAGLKQRFQAALTDQVHSAYNNLIYLEAEDYIECFIYHTQGGNVNIAADDEYNFFSIYRVGLER